jgi:hypothetical protein
MSDQKSSAISIVLSDGDPDGIRTAEIGVSSTKVIAFRRSQLEKVCANFSADLKNHGVYLLYGQDPITEADVVYIGESQSVASRLKQHNSKDQKDYWTDTVVMISQNDNLLKSHIQYIEAKLVSVVKHNVSWKLANEKLIGEKPQKAATLPQAETIKMRDFIDEATLLTRTLGCDVFKATTGNLIKQTADSASNITPDSPEFRHVGTGFDAKAVVSGASGDWIVKATSRARIIGTNALPNGVNKLRDRLKAAGVLVESNGYLEFKEDCSFSSASTAANVVGGTPINGRLAWKLASGANYAQWESSQAAIDPLEFSLA